MNRETMQARVLLLQQNVDIQSQQIESLVTNLKVLQGHLAEAKHWLAQFGDEPAPDAPPALPNEGDNNNATQEGNEQQENESDNAVKEDDALEG